MGPERSHGLGKPWKTLWAAVCRSPHRLPMPSTPVPGWPSLSLFHPKCFKLAEQRLESQMLFRILMGRQWGMRVAFQVLNVQPIQPKTKASLGPKDLAFCRINLRWKMKLNGRQVVVHDKEELCQWGCPGEKGAPLTSWHAIQKEPALGRGTRWCQRTIQHYFVTLAP